MRADSPAGRQEEEARTQEASQGAPYAHGSGRPKDIPDTAVVLNQHMITRESLDSSVPAALKLKERIKPTGRMTSRQWIRTPAVT